MAEQKRAASSLRAFTITNWSAACFLCGKELSECRVYSLSGRKQAE